EVQDTLGNTLHTINHLEPSVYPNTAMVQLNGITNEILLKTTKTDTIQNNGMVFGLDLENDSSGIVFSAVGVNGAEAFEYVAARYFAEETQVINPQLFIISLGTNEAQRRPFDKELTEARLDSLVKQLRTYNPTVPIILTTPPDSYFHYKYYNTAVAAIHSMYVEYAKAHNIAVWDLYSVTGGYKSCYMWKHYGLMRRDGVHFTRGGYEFQGNLFYEALIKSYNSYVAHRFP
ncbi:MAG TPA: GDSL-type esterase/lipase family protein, partial [Chitinophagales bacterium]|nr:GDSL-type esterase/lipase family protein [Chitinophagales bacterium]